jgi:hypothetical protein
MFKNGQIIDINFRQMPKELVDDVDSLVEEGKLVKVMSDSGEWTGLVKITQKGIEAVEANFSDDPDVRKVMEKHGQED